MTQQHAAEQQTAAAPRRNRTLRYTAIAAAIVLAVAGIIWLVNATGSAAPVDYRVSAHGNISATWTSDTAAGKLDLYNGDNAATVHAGTLTVTVQSTMPDGASCKIDDAHGNIVDSQSQMPAAGVSGLDAWTTVTCSTMKS
jgi:hypothetical protein